MGERIHALAQVLFGKSSIEECSVEELQHLVKRYPYFAPAQFMLLQKLKTAGLPFDAQQQKAVLYYPDPLQFEFFISPENFSTGEPLLAEETQSNTTTVAKISAPEEITATANSPEQQTSLQQSTISEPAQTVIEEQTIPPVLFLYEIPIVETKVETVAAVEKEEALIEETVNEKTSDPVHYSFSNHQTFSGEATQPADLVNEEGIVSPIEIPLSTKEEAVEALVEIANSSPDETVELKQQSQIKIEDAITEEETEPLTKDDAHEPEDEKEFHLQDAPAEIQSVLQRIPPANKKEPISTAPAADTGLVFEPYHTVDYFASQGIKVSADDLSKDKLGKQVRSFTEWLKMMKRLPASEIAKTPTTVAEKSVAQLASHSISESEVVTEAMAEVWAKQGNREKALETYNKLCLLNPSKKAYFAAKIENLKLS